MKQKVKKIGSHAAKRSTYFRQNVLSYHIRDASKTVISILLSNSMQKMSIDMKISIVEISMQNISSINKATS